MRTRYRSIVAATLVALTLLTASLAPAGAYYGETEGYRTIDFSADGRGCYGHITVYSFKSVQMFCDIRNASSGQILAVTNYTEYYCPYVQCGYDFDIGGQPGFYAIGVWSMKKTDYSGLHATIDSVGSH